MHQKQKQIISITLISILILVIFYMPSYFETDSDNDGIEDKWETQYGLDPNDPNDSQLDFDNDKLLNIAEYQNNTNPRNNDTDGDKLDDYLELVTLNTNPSVNDTDYDELNDWFEVNIEKSDPLIQNGRKAILVEIPLPDAPFGVGLECTEWILKNKFRFNDTDIDILRRPTKEQFQDSINQINASENDLVYVQILAHTGNLPPNTVINLYQDGKNVSFDELDDWLDTIICRKMVVVLATCDSGSGGEALSDDDNPCPRVIYTSAGHEVSTASNFIKYFTTSYGVRLTSAYGEIEFTHNDEDNADLYGNNDGFISFQEAFEYSVLLIEENRESLNLQGTPQVYGDIELGTSTYLGDYEYIS